jgi:hypothetical protein
MRKIAIIFLILVGSALAQTALPTTTLTASVNANPVVQNFVQLASNANVVDPKTSRTQTLLYVDTELMNVLAIAPITGILTVERGYNGTKANSHNSGATVYVGTPNQFFNYDPSGACTAGGISVTPFINIFNGNQWTCVGGLWTLSSSGSGGGGSTVSALGSAPGGKTFLVTSSPYNAKCDGTTDDSVAIQAAINAAQANGSGTVVFPFGTCITSTTLTITASYVSLQGQYQRGSVIQNSTAGNDILQITGASPQSQVFNQINNLTFQRSVAGTGTSNGIKFTNVNTLSITFVESYDSVNDFNQVSGDANIQYFHCQAVANLGTVTNGWLITSSTSTYITDSNSVAVANTITNAINLSAGSGVRDFWALRFNVATGGGTITTSGIGVVSDIHFVNLISEPGGSNMAISLSGNNVNAGTINQIEFIGSHIVTSTGVAVSLTNEVGIQIIGGEFNCPAATLCLSISGASSTNNAVTGALFKCIPTGTCPMIAVASGANGNTVSSNTFIGGSSTGAFTTAIASTGSSNNVYSGNTFAGFGTTAISLDATSNNNQLCGNNVVTTNITNVIVNSGAGNNCAMTNATTATNCVAVGTAANPSLVACGSAQTGAFSCSVSASTGTCVVSSTAVTANSEIFITPNTSESTRLGVTCNAAPTLVPTIQLISKSAGASFTITVPTISTNPACYDYTIVN